MQGALSSSSTLDQLQAFAKTLHQEHADDKDLAWQVLYLALRAGHIDVAIKVRLLPLLLVLLLPKLHLLKSFCMQELWLMHASQPIVLSPMLSPPLLPPMSTV